MPAFLKFLLTIYFGRKLTWVSLGIAIKGDLFYLINIWYIILFPFYFIFSSLPFFNVVMQDIQLGSLHECSGPSTRRAGGTWPSWWHWGVFGCLAAACGKNGSPSHSARVPSHLALSSWLCLPGFQPHSIPYPHTEGLAAFLSYSPFRLFFFKLILLLFFVCTKSHLEGMLINLSCHYIIFPCFGIEANLFLEGKRWEF